MWEVRMQRQSGPQKMSTNRYVSRVSNVIAAVATSFMAPPMKRYIELFNISCKVPFKRSSNFPKLEGEEKETSETDGFHT